MKLLQRIFAPQRNAVPVVPAQFFVHLTPANHPDQNVSMEGMAKIFQTYMFFSTQKSVDAAKAAIRISSHFYDYLSREILENTDDLVTLGQIMRMEGDDYHLYLSATEVLHYLKAYTESLNQTRQKLTDALTMVDQELSNFTDLSKLDEVLGAN